MRNWTFSVGIGGVLAKIAAIKGRMTKDALEEIGTAGAEVFLEESKILCPVDDGDLRDSIQIRETIVAGPLLVKVPMGPDAPQAARIEFGFKGPDSLGRHFHQLPHSYIRASYDTKREDARAAMLTKAKEILSGG